MTCIITSVYALQLTYVSDLLTILMCDGTYCLYLYLEKFIFLIIEVSESIGEEEMQRTMATPRQSLCAEMAGELCFALRCRGSRQRPALKRQCSKCVPTTTSSTYMPALPAGLEPPHLQPQDLRSRRTCSIGHSYDLREEAPPIPPPPPPSQRIRLTAERRD